MRPLCSIEQSPGRARPIHCRREERARPSDARTPVAGATQPESQGPCGERESDAHSSDRPRSSRMAGSVREALADIRNGVIHRRVRWRGSSMGSNGCAGAGLPRCCSICARPDGQGIAALEQVWQTAPHVPILVIGSPDGEGAAVADEVTRGAQDYFYRDRLDSYTLPRALKRIIERKAADEALFFEQQRAEVTLNSIGDAVLSTDIHGQRDLSQSRGRTHDGLAASGGVGPAARRGVPDRRRDDARTRAEPDGPGHCSSTESSA